MKALLRREIFKNLSMIKELMITETDIKLIGHIQDQETCTVNDVKNVWDASTQHISTKLASLYSKGYLMRRELKSASGGIEYVYWVFMD